MPRIVKNAVDTLVAPIDSAWLATFRILYGVVMSVSMLRFLAYGWIDRLFVAPEFHFKYWGFEWVEPLSAGGMYALFSLLLLLALAVAAGAFFRLTAPLFALGLAYVQLIDVSTYLNHYYLAALLALLLALSPAHRSWSLDAWWKKRQKTALEAQGTCARAWLYLFRFQVGIVYVFAGLAKAQSDWLLHAQPLRIWLGAKTSLPIVGPLFTVDWVPLAMSWTGFLFDTSVVAFLFWRKTRPWAYAVLIAFHVMTRVLFPIGMFPVIMTSAALLFFEPSWPRTAWSWVQGVARWIGRGGPFHVLPRLCAPVVVADSRAVPARRGWHALALSLGVFYCVVQLILPLRFIAYGGNVLWHEQGMRFAWRVMLRAKGGSTTLLVENERSGRTWHVNPKSYLTGMQEMEMVSQPDLILQLAHHVEQDFERRGLGPVFVRVDSRASLNGRRSAPFIDPGVDLASIDDGIVRAEWVLPAPTEPPPHTRPVL